MPEVKTTEVKAIEVKVPFRCGGQVVKTETILEVGRNGDVTMGEARSLVGQRKAEWIDPDEIEVEEGEE